MKYKLYLAVIYTEWRYMRSRTAALLSRIQDNQFAHIAIASVATRRAYMGY